MIRIFSLLVIVIGTGLIGIAFPLAESQNGNQTDVDTLQVQRVQLLKDRVSAIELLHLKSERIRIQIQCETLKLAKSTLPQDVTASKDSDMTHKLLFEKLTGQWEGTCRTWFEPDKLADESKVAGRFTPVLGGRFLRHTYEGSIQKKTRHGEELIAFNSVTKNFQSSWVDDFHMNYAILFSQGDAADGGFEVFGEYDVGENQPRWGWKTVYKLIDDDHLTITAYNVSPEKVQAKAVETTYVRVSKGP